MKENDKVIILAAAGMTFSSAITVLLGRYGVFFAIGNLIATLSLIVISSQKKEKSQNAAVEK